ncbi:MAG: isoamylase early set domain-containing protein [Spirochaetales bacterium]|nr:isoamylase early set domain-containing protein [Spirochaetales bacterium]
MKKASSALSTDTKVEKNKNSAWKVPLSAYGAGFLFFIISGLLFVFTGIPGIEKDMILISFSLSEPEAESVALVADFNDWNPVASQMTKINGIWEIKVKLKKGQVYTYNFVINGREWITDPYSLLNVDDGFGGKSSILKL